MKHYLSKKLEKKNEYSFILESPSPTNGELIQCRIKRNKEGVYTAQVNALYEDELGKAKKLDRYTGYMISGDANSITYDMSRTEGLHSLEMDWRSIRSAKEHYFLTLPLEIDTERHLGAFLYTSRAVWLLSLGDFQTKPVVMVQTIESWLENFPEDDKQYRKHNLEKQFNCKLDLREITVQHDSSYIKADIIRRLIKEQETSYVFGDENDPFRSLLYGSVYQANLYKAGRSLIKTTSEKNKELENMIVPTNNKWPFIIDLENTALECCILPDDTTLSNKSAQIVVKNIMSCVITTANCLNISKRDAWFQIYQHLNYGALYKHFVISSKEFKWLEKVSEWDSIECLVGLNDMWVIEYNDLLTNLNYILTQLKKTEVCAIRAIIKDLSETKETLLATYYVIDIAIDTFDNSASMGIDIEPVILRYGNQNANMYPNLFGAITSNIEYSNWDKGVKEVSEVLNKMADDLKKFKQADL